MLVLDDGWFGKRDTDHSGLGDWHVNEKKLQGSLSDLVKQINDMGLKFGIWIEPEMANEDSDLYREHPGWVYSIPGRKPVLGRHQLVPDFSRKEVVDYIFDSITKVIDSANIEYIKMDMNRSICDVYTAVKGYQNYGKMTKDLKEKNGIRWMGVWHALGGFWGGIVPESPLAQKEAPYLYRTVSGKPSPMTGERFYRDWYEELNREGISFAKVDGQSSAACYFENCLPVCEAVRGINEAPESGASRMDGAVINCMGMAMAEQAGSQCTI